MDQEKQVLIVGAGLAGLCCARELEKKGVSTLVLEADSRVGGRLKTDHHEGFLLDHGFQVLLTSYPEAKEKLNFEQLNLGLFEPGALIRFNGKFHRFVDPWRKPLSVFSTLFSPLATLSDKLRVAKLRQKVTRLEESQIRNQNPVSTNEYLKRLGFSSNIIDRFFRPFFGGVFLESELETSSVKFEYLFKMFSTGSAALPENGMQSIAEQIVSELPPESIKLNTHVSAVSENALTLSDGSQLNGDQIVLATPAHITSRLLNEDKHPEFQKVACVYFAADKSPLNVPTLVLNGDGTGNESAGPVNTVCVPSDVSSNYAPPGKSLISVSILEPHVENDPSGLLDGVRRQLRDWFGEEVDRWEHLKTHVITHALPQQPPAKLLPSLKPTANKGKILICGDHLGIASIQGAMRSGRETAEAIINT